MAAPDAVTFGQDTVVEIAGVEVGVKSGGMTFRAEAHDITTTKNAWNNTALRPGRNRKPGLRECEINLTFQFQSDVSPHASASLDLNEGEYVDINVWVHGKDFDFYALADVCLDMFQAQPVGDPAAGPNLYQIHGYTSDYLKPDEV